MIAMVVASRVSAVQNVAEHPDPQKFEQPGTLLAVRDGQRVRRRQGQAFAPLGGFAAFDRASARRLFRFAGPSPLSARNRQTGAADVELWNRKIRRFADGSDEVIGALIDVHQALGPGLLEAAYEACFFRELHLRGLGFERQRPVGIAYKGLMVDCG